MATNTVGLTGKGGRKTKKAMRIVLADGREFIRLGFRRVLEPWEAKDDTKESLSDIAKLRPDIVYVGARGVVTEQLDTPLTSRELEVLAYVAHGCGNKQIAHTLNISEQTIKNHISAIMRKLDANDRTHAVVLAMHNGWISMGERKEALARQ